jgi:hypothetical protein
MTRARLALDFKFCMPRAFRLREDGIASPRMVQFEAQNILR